ncbi:MAG: DUF433 domain-containing protein [Bryobacterales bacterium]|nr:DUF433 domain-containing protein [Bryobacterales bacterium]
MRSPARAESKPGVMMGKPCVQGTRIPVYLILEKMAAGETAEQLLAAYPQLTVEDLRACLAYAAALAADEVPLAGAWPAGR